MLKSGGSSSPICSAFLFYSLFVYFYFWLCWVFVAACGLSLVAVRRDYSLVAVHELLIVVAFLVEHMQALVVEVPGL